MSGSAHKTRCPLAEYLGLAPGQCVTRSTWLKLTWAASSSEPKLVLWDLFRMAVQAPGLVRHLGPCAYLQGPEMLGGR